MTRGSTSLVSIDKLDIALPKGADRPLAVSNATLSVERGQIVCIVGESGSGKSVLASAVAGLLPSDSLRVVSGSLTFDGENVLALSEPRLRRLRGARIGYVFQEPMTALNPLLTVGRQVRETLQAHGRSGAADEITSLFASMHLPHPETIVQRYPHELSGGQRQRVAIAIAIACDPELLIADEPTTALDVTTQSEILKLILELRAERGLAVLFITHDFGVVRDIADLIVVMQDGQIVETGISRELLASPGHPYTRRLLSAVPDLTSTPHRDAVNTSAILELSNICKRHKAPRRVFGNARQAVPALNGVNLVLRQGETLSLVGESGSGKSTLGQVITGLLERDEGQFRFMNEEIVRARDLFIRARRPLIQMVFQDPQSSLNPRHTVRRVLTEAAINCGLTKDTAEVRMRELLGRVGIDPSAADRRPHAFSGGQRQRIALARALMLEPRLLVADEPVSALDVSVQAQVLKLLSELQRDLGLSVLFITHDLRVAASISDTIAVMQGGKIVEVGPAGEIISNPKSTYARKLIASIPGRHSIKLRAESFAQRDFA
ncbi:ABC transporter ATP-binding protein [Rhizobium cauense]|uniref:dipeptide ABC transporter ATP-binding protein n=1 Tax=Rhizobium cauense TaxID=1166683 RepID=UPI001C6F3183|nr:ABC transporter ATP-binding protein [Rhizobium cauense]MBW9116809.1 ABC transporter ATP-binding protein [Rhizobium cauense]